MHECVNTKYKGSTGKIFGRAKQATKNAVYE